MNTQNATKGPILEPRAIGLRAASALLRGLMAALFVVIGAAARVRSAAADDSVEAGGLWFPVGEKIEYRIYWGVIGVGTATVTTEWVDVQGRRVLLIRSRAVSNRVLEKLYPVNDVVEAMVDMETFRPLVFVKNLREGRHRYYEVTTFDYTKGKARWCSVIKEQDKEFPIEQDSRDLLSFLYYMRARPLAEGEEQRHRVMADDKIYDLLVRVTATEQVKLARYGRVKCLKVEPEAAFQGLFVRKGKMTLWISTDERRLMTMAVVDTPFANVKLALDSVEGPGNDFWVAP